jgi:hypothetical protein
MLPQVKFFAAKNLVSTAVAPCVPWEFKPTEIITAQIRADKTTRQEWYRTASTNHCFYSCIEGVNASQRVGKENPARLLHGISADYDMPLTPDRVQEAIKIMSIKPAWIERSLSGNARLVWEFPRPVQVDGNDFLSFILERTEKWLKLGLLPGLDTGALTTTSRLLCNGCEWASTGHGPIPENTLQAFFVDCAREFNFNPTGASEIPLEVIEPALRAAFPAFSWPADFELESQGPSFWVPGSTSPMSAIVKKEGMISFAAHAEKPFYTWSDILGKEFVQKFDADSIAKATSDIWWDGKNFWRKIAGRYARMAERELVIYFKKSCMLPGNKVEDALNHIFTVSRIEGAAPFVFRPAGKIEYQGDPILNTYVDRAIKPADELTEWGPAGKFPFLSRHFDALFDPPEQLPWFLAWYKHLYTACYTHTPYPGQNIFLMGGVHTGKTLTSRAIVGYSVGGFVDASSYLTKGNNFNAEMCRVAVQCVDDESMGESSANHNHFQAMMKKSAANQEFQYNKKFETPVTVEWMGRIIVTSNLDHVSSRSLGPMDDSSLDKISIFRCASKSKIDFPNRTELRAIIQAELPYFLRWLLQWVPPAHILRDVRFGYRSYHEKTLLDQAHQTSTSAPFKELLIEGLRDFFVTNPKAIEWRGTVTQVMRLLHSNPLNETIIRNLRLEQINRHLELVQRENLFVCECQTGDFKTRVWVFPRAGMNLPPPETPLVCDPPPVGIVNIFSK